MPAGRPTTLPIRGLPEKTQILQTQAQYDVDTRDVSFPCLRLGAPGIDYPQNVEGGNPIQTLAPNQAWGDTSFTQVPRYTIIGIEICGKLKISGDVDGDGTRESMPFDLKLLHEDLNSDGFLHPFTMTTTVATVNPQQDARLYLLHHTHAPTSQSIQSFGHSFPKCNLRCKTPNGNVKGAAPAFMLYMGNMAALSGRITGSFTVTFKWYKGWSPSTKVMANARETGGPARGFSHALTAPGDEHTLTGQYWPYQQIRVSSVLQAEAYGISGTDKNRLHIANDSGYRIYTNRRVSRRGAGISAGTQQYADKGGDVYARDGMNQIQRNSITQKFLNARKHAASIRKKSGTDMAAYQAKATKGEYAQAVKYNLDMSRARAKAAIANRIAKGQSFSQNKEYNGEYNGHFVNPYSA